MAQQPMQESFDIRVGKTAFPNTHKTRVSDTSNPRGFLYSRFPRDSAVSKARRIVADRPLHGGGWHGGYPVNQPYQQTRDSAFTPRRGERKRVCKKSLRATRLVNLKT
jgi:hypothetical protein